MPQRTTWTTVLFLYKDERLRRIEQTKQRGFHVGIWWNDAERLVACLQSIDEIEAVGHLIDSDLSHDSAWETVCHELSCHEGSEYFHIPRGRIVWDTVNRAGILYHGNSTPAIALNKLSRIYRLPRWEARLDEHYLIDEALEDFYRLE